MSDLDAPRQNQIMLRRAVAEVFGGEVVDLDLKLNGVYLWLLRWPDGAELLEQELSRNVAQHDPEYVRRREALRHLVTALRGLL